MKERPILFSAPMIRALLAGTKTQTRRIVKPGAPDDWNACPYGVIGDRLWVRETHAPAADSWGAWERRMQKDGCGPAPVIHYAADGGDPFVEKWRPSIHMPRWASRITLEIVAVRVERLQDISEADVAAEGVLVDDIAPPYWRSYRELWEQINGAGSWDLNPWVWIVEFTRAQP
jgi:hypothetical protein